MAAKTIKGPKKSGVCDLRWISIGVCVCLFVFFPPGSFWLTVAILW